MTDLARNGSVLVAEIKAIHPPQDGSIANGSAEHTNGEVPGVNNGAHIPIVEGAHPGTATDGGVAAPAIDSSLTSPPEHSHLANGSAAHASESEPLNAGTGAIAVPGHAADPSVATGVHEPVQHSSEAAPLAAAGGAAVGGAAAPGLIQPQTTPIQPIQPSERAVEPTSQVNAAAPTGAAGAGAVEPTSAAAVPAATGAPATSSAFPAAAAGAAGVGAAGAAAVPIVAHPAPTTVAANAAPKAALPPKEVKKMDKLMKTEAKNENKSIKRAIKDASESEKLFRKSREAEAQAVKRHQKATTKEHKAAKLLSKVKAEYEKVAAELAKSVEDLDIKKKHTESTRSGYEASKRHIDELRNQKTVNDQARSRQASQLHHPSL